MANVNDFKNVYQKSLVMGRGVTLHNGAVDDDSTRAQIGFYLLVLELVTNVKEQSEQIEMIIDDKFNKDLFGKGNDDLGIDAVYIDDDRKVIQLFNFKFRREFKENSTTKETDAYDSVRFFSVLESENTNGLAPKTKAKAREIINRYKSLDEYKTELIMVANVNNAMPIDSNIERYKELFDIQIKSIILDDIVAYISDFPEDKKAELIVDSDAVLTYEMDAYSTLKSFLVKISLAELVRITCTDDSLRNNPINDYGELQNAKLEMSLLFENVRGYLGNTKYNTNIVSSINETPNKFFMFNNGITFTAKNVIAEPRNGNKMCKINMEGFQIVNGGQTIRSVYKFCEKAFDAEKLSTAEILIRIFQTERDDELKNDIAEYTNSQNAIGASDLKSVSNLQRQIEIFLGTKEVAYIRKAGDVGPRKNNYPISISMEKLAQILYAYKGYPERASNAKKRLFSTYYNEIFPEDLDFDEMYEILMLYLDIVKEYEKSRYEKFEQKYLMILYMKKKAQKNTIKQLITMLEKTLDSFEPEIKIAKSRKILKVSFRKEIEEQLEKIKRS